MAEKLVVKDLFKVFGRNVADALRLLSDGLNKDEIYERTLSTIAVNNANFTVKEGEVFVIMGLSGSGKSTLVRMLNRLIEPTSGEILLDGRDIAKLGKDDLIQVRRRDIGMVFQSFALMPHLTVRENAEFGLAVAGVAAEERRERALSALDKVGLKANAEAYPAELSGGMQQRVGLARALAQDPDILLMDEAFSALDPLIRTEMQDELLRIQEEDSRTIIFISHDLDEAMRIGDRIAIMESGRIVQVGTPDEILRDPADDYVRSFFRGVDVRQVYTAGDVARNDGLTMVLRPGDGVRAALERLRRNNHEFGYVHDKGKRFQGVVSVQSLKEALDGGEDRFERAFLADVTPLGADVPLTEVLSQVAASPCPLPVVDAANLYRGVISKSALLETMDRTAR